MTALGKGNCIVVCRSSWLNEIVISFRYKPTIKVIRKSIAKISKLTMKWISSNNDSPKSFNLENVFILD